MQSHEGIEVKMRSMCDVFLEKKIKQTDKIEKHFRCYLEDNIFVFL